MKREKELENENARLKEEIATLKEIIVKNNISQQKTLKAYNSVVNSTNNQIFMVDPEGIILFANDPVKNFIGYTPYEIIGSNIIDLVHPDDTDITDINYLKKFSSKLREIEFRIINKKGNEIWVDARLQPNLDNDGKTILFTVIIQDITDFKRAKEELNELEDAKRIQSALLPKNLQHVNWLETSYRYMPMLKVSGDFISIQYLRELDAIGVFIGDVVGHGVSAAFYTFLLKLLTDRMYRKHGGTPEEYIIELNHSLIKEFHFSSMDAKQGMFITGIYVLFRKELNGKVKATFSKAGHPDPIIYKNGKSEILYSKGYPLGLFEDTEYQTKDIVLEKGDRLIVYTDGLLELTRSGKDMSGINTFLDIIDNAKDNSLENSLNSIMDRASEIRGNEPLRDDIILFGAQVM